MGTVYIANEEHYTDVLLKALEAKRTLWIGLHALGTFDTRKSPCKSIPRMNRKLARRPQIAINFCITPWSNNLLRRTE